LPTIALGNDTTLCQGETVTLYAKTPKATYMWQDNSTKASFKVTQQGTYWTEVRVNNCSTADTILVNYNPFPTIALGKDTILCQGETLTLDATTSNATYLWQDNSTNSNLKVTQQGIYWVKITDGCGSASDTMNIHYSLLPTIALGNDTTLCQGETVTLDAITPNATYLWQDNSTNPTFKVTHQGAYWVEVTVNNCSALSTVLIVEEDCKITLEIPDVFTPNNDGINDLFVPIDSKGIVSMNTIIYNRWGEKVFESNKLLIEWSGQDVSDGTYFWIVNYTDINGVSNSIKGFVTILR
jgi:gliding motility-associated-like protein